MDTTGIQAATSGCVFADESVYHNRTWISGIMDGRSFKAGTDFNASYFRCSSIGKLSKQEN